MVTDDSVTVRKVTTRFLEREGFNVITAKDGVDALRVLQDGLPDLMLLDIEMPRMDGFGLIETVRGNGCREMPILVLTTESSDEKKQRARSAGATGWIVKPFQPDKLAAAIRRVLH